MSALASRAAGVALVALLLGASPTPPPQAIHAEPAIQRDIAAVAAATTAAELQPPLARLREAGRPDNSALMPQLVLFSMHSTDVHEGMATAVVIRELGITREQQLNGIAPYLATTDAALGRELRNFLGNLDDGSARTPPDFRHYQSLLRARRKDPPIVLVQYMLETAPDQGLETLTEVWVTDPSRRAALMSARGTRTGATLERLAGDEEWWVRLYVAERLRQDPSLRTPALLGRLLADPNPIVRASIAAP